MDDRKLGKLIDTANSASNRFKAVRDLMPVDSQYDDMYYEIYGKLFNEMLYYEDRVRQYIMNNSN